MRPTPLPVFVFIMLFISGCMEFKGNPAHEKEIERCNQYPEIIDGHCPTCPLYPRYDCLVDLAVKYNDSVICKQINQSKQIQGCLIALALRYNDPTICDQIDPSFIERIRQCHCVVASGSDYGLCYNYTKAPGNYPIQQKIPEETHGTGTNETGDGILIGFDSPLGNDTNLFATGSPYAAKINGTDWVVLEIDIAGPRLLIGRQEAYIANMCAYENETNRLKVGNKTLFYEGYEVNDTQTNARVYAALFNDSESEFAIPLRAPVLINGGYVYVWGGGFAFECARASVSVFSRIMNISAQDGAVFIWDNGSANQKLESVFIPRSSPIFEKLSG